MKSITVLLPSLAIAALLLNGCGTAEDTSSDTWQTPPPVSVNARLEYKVDSLTNENRRLAQQVDALSTENRNLTARAAELETRLNEMAATPKPEPVAKPSTMTASTDYDGALATFHQKKFSDAIQEFEGLLNGNVREDLADNCNYWIGESYYALRQYKEAVDHFKTVLGYNKSEKKSAAQLMIGNAYLAMGDKEAAKAAYNTLVSSYPVSSLVEKAKEKLARLK
jgi:tol-pal system protein YbgF